VAVLLVAGAVGAFLYFGQDDDEELDAAAGEECRTHALAEAMSNNQPGAFHQAQDWRVNGVTHGYVDVAAKTGKLFVVSGDLDIEDVTGRVTRQNFVCRLELTEQGDWQLLEMGQPSSPDR
jgi:hypothetical protein